MLSQLETIESELKKLEEKGIEGKEKVDLLVRLAEALPPDQGDRIMECGEEALEISNRLDYKFGIAFAQACIGFAHYLRSNHKSAHEWLTSALERFIALGEERGQAITMNAMAGVLFSMGHYDRAMAHAAKGLKIFQKIGDRLQEAWALNGFGTGFTDFGNYEKATEYHQESLDIFRELGNLIGEARALVGLGTILLRTGRFEEAEERFQESLLLFQQAGETMGEARALNDLGIIHQKRGEMDKAIEFHNRSLKLRINLENLQSQSTSLIHLGTIYNELRQPDKALAVLEKALKIAEDIGARPRIYQAHQALAETLEQAGRFEEALYHHKAFHSIKETVIGEESQAAINNLRTGFALERAEKETEIARLRNVELKEKNDQLEVLLEKLRETQNQLVQSEKLASLGRLTAGIAHEIKNPLNFVNNFSLLTRELIDDLDEIVTPYLETVSEQDRTDLEDILEDLRFNGSKIYEHGQRADRIVKNMLEHARTRSNERRAVDINALLDEYVNLAYHGMRAETSAFNATLHRSYDPSIPQVVVNPQDISRVFINLLNNAFYALFERTNSEGPSFGPTAWIETKRIGDEVEIRIKNNGPVIPEEIINKIFEPFFTTKPTGSGTGLGLSLSFEIITQRHRGHMWAESSEADGTAFFIRLPLNES